MLSSAAILGVEDCMPNRLEQVDNVIACLCDSKSMATAVNKYFRERSRDGQGVLRHLITYEDAMEALTVVDHETGPSPTQGCYARFNSSPARTPKPAAAKSSRTPMASPQAIQPVKGGRGPKKPRKYPRCFLPKDQCWQCGLAGTGHTWNACDHPCLNCGGPSAHTPGGHKTQDCENPRKGSHNLTFWSPVKRRLARCESPILYWNGNAAMRQLNGQQGRWPRGGSAAYGPLAANCSLASDTPTSVQPCHHLKLAATSCEPWREQKG